MGATAPVKRIINIPREVPVQSPATREPIKEPVKVRVR
jgi:hypothetical protein